MLRIRGPDANFNCDGATSVPAGWTEASAFCAGNPADGFLADVRSGEFFLRLSKSLEYRDLVALDEHPAADLRVVADA